MHLQNNLLTWKPGISSNHLPDPVQPYFSETTRIWALKFILSSHAPIAHEFSSPPQAGLPCSCSNRASFCWRQLRQLSDSFKPHNKKRWKEAAFKMNLWVTPSQARRVAVSCRQQGHRLEWQPVPSAQRHPCSPDKGLAPSHRRHSFAEQLHLGLNMSHCTVGLMRSLGHCL